MPIKKTVKTKKTTKAASNKNKIVETPVTISEIEQSETSSTITKMTNSKVFYVVAIILLLVALLYYLVTSFKKDWFVAATVNNSPITNFELFAKMNQQFRQKTLDQMIDEKIISDEAKKKGIMVTDKDIDDKIAELEKGYGGQQVFDNLLEQEGLTRDSIRSQIKSSLLLEKMYSGEATVSAEEVAQFLENNSGLIQSTDSAQQAKDAEAMLKEQKAGQLYQEKFKQLKDSAQIKRF